MGRYRVSGDWSTDNELSRAPFFVEFADALDTKTGTTYTAGAFRVIYGPRGRPARNGKGGTTPFFGETAWSDAERLASDLYWEARRNER